MKPDDDTVHQKGDHPLRLIREAAPLKHAADIADREPADHFRLIRGAAPLKLPLVGKGGAGLGIFRLIREAAPLLNSAQPALRTSARARQVLNVPDIYNVFSPVIKRCR